MERWVKALIISIPLFQYSNTPLFLPHYSTTPSLHIFITPFLLLFVYLCPDSYVSENFKKDRMFYSAVDNMRMGRTPIQGI